MKRNLTDFIDKKFDLLIIGGGISGAAIAWDASLRGLRVALLEKNDFGGATSAATSKLIHGGLRYLKNFEYGLVRESLRERRILETIAPHMVYPLPFLIPTYRKSANPKTVLRAGMILYDFLSFDKGWIKDKSKKLPSHQVISPKEVLEQEPNVLEKGLNGGIVYYDTLNVIPERLTLTFILSAVGRGAKVLNYAEVTGFIKEANSVKGLKIRDWQGDTEFNVLSDLVVVAAGPWADFVLNRALDKKNEIHVRLSRGIHIITEKKVNRHAVLLNTKKGRHFFAIPWRGYTLFGTTDKEYFGNPDQYRVTREEMLEFIDEINESFGKEKIREADVLYTYGGLRPITDTQTEGTYNASRRYEIVNHKTDGIEGLISVVGGKYTTSRNLAEKVVDDAMKQLNLPKVDCATGNTPLVGGEIDDLVEFRKEVYRQNPGLSPEMVEVLLENYGTRYPEVTKWIKKSSEFGKILGKNAGMVAEVVHSIEEEMAITLTDILLRRTGIGMLGNPGVKDLQIVANLAAKQLGWTEKRKKAEIDFFLNKVYVPGREQTREPISQADLFHL